MQGGRQSSGPDCGSDMEFVEGFCKSSHHFEMVFHIDLIRDSHQSRHHNTVRRAAPCRTVRKRRDSAAHFIADKNN